MGDPFTIESMAVLFLNIFLTQAAKKLFDNEILQQLVTTINAEFSLILQMIRKFPDSKALRQILLQMILRKMRSDRLFAETIKASLINYMMFLENKINVAKAAGRLDQEVDSLMMLAEIYLMRGKWVDSLHLYNISLNIFSEKNDCHGQCHALIGIGNAYDKQGHFSEARGTYELALSKIDPVKDSSIKAEILNNIANINVEEKKWDMAISNYGEALNIYRYHGMIHSECETLMNMGVALRENGNLEESLNIFRDALQKSQKIGDIYIENAVRVNLANTNFNLRRYSEAREDYEKSLGILNALGDQQGMAVVLMNLGSICYISKQYTEALKRFDECIKIYCDISDRRDECIALINRGNVYRDMHQWDSSFDDYRKSLNISRMFNDRFNEGQVLRNMGVAHLNLNNLEDAIKVFNDALSIFKDMGDVREEAGLLINRAIAYANNQEKELAKRDLIDATGKSRDADEIELVEYLLNEIERQSGGK